MREPARRAAELPTGRGSGRQAGELPAGSGRRARIVADSIVAGAWVLELDGAEQSHVDLGDPASLFYDYVRRIGASLDRLADPGRPLRAVHLGAGALTLARYLQATRPGSEQLAVELTPGLLAEIVERMPLPAGTRLTVREGDAADVVADLLAGPAATQPESGAAARPPEVSGRTPWRGSADVVIDDLYRGITTPPHLTTPEWYAAAAGLLAEDGVLIVNVADDDGLPGLRGRLEALAPSLPHALLLGPSSVLRDERAGNAVILASRSTRVLELAEALRRAGPHPAEALSAEGFGGRPHRNAPEPPQPDTTPKGR
jgi:hypothetical protein